MSDSFLARFYSGYCQLVEKNTLGVEIGVYTLSGLVLASVYRQIRPITKFVSPYDIPKHFIRKQLVQQGTVSRIEGSLLKVNHRPLVSVGFRSGKTLPVKIAAIELNTHGLSWLQGVVVNRPIQFLPLACTSSSAECRVELISTVSKKPNLDVAEALLSLGFARITEVPEFDPKDKKMETYFRNLARIESRARSRRAGLWSNSIPPPIWPMRVAQYALDNLILAVGPKNRRLPELVR